MEFPKTSHSCEAVTGHGLTARFYKLSEHNGLWWRKHESLPGPGVWSLEVSVRTEDGGGVTADVPLGPVAPGILLYAAALLQGVAK